MDQIHLKSQFYKGKRTILGKETTAMEIGRLNHEYQFTKRHCISRTFTSQLQGRFMVNNGLNT